MIGLVLVSLLSRRFAVSSAHGGGLIAGFVGNELAGVREQQGARPAHQRRYATLFVSGQIVEVILVQVIVSAAS